MGVSSEYERSAMENAMGVAWGSRGNDGKATRILSERSRGTMEILWEDNWNTAWILWGNYGNPKGNLLGCRGHMQ